MWYFGGHHKHTWNSATIMPSNSRSCVVCVSAIWIRPSWKGGGGVHEAAALGPRSCGLQDSPKPLRLKKQHLIKGNDLRGESSNRIKRLKIPRKLICGTQCMVQTDRKRKDMACTTDSPQCRFVNFRWVKRAPENEIPPHE